MRRTTNEVRAQVRELVGNGASLAEAARTVGVSPATASRIVAEEKRGVLVSPTAASTAMTPAPAAPLPQKFDSQYLAHTFVAPVDVTSFYSWEVPTILGVRNEHMRGEFSRSTVLAAAMKTCPPIYSSLMNRIAPPSGLARRIVGPSEDIREQAAAWFGPRSLAFAAVPDGFETQAMMGQAIFQNVWSTRDDGSRRDVHLEPWPSEAVVVDATTGRFKALTRDGLVDIVHGDGKWVVAKLHYAKSWQWGAIVALAGLWPENALTRRDRNQAVEAHGQIKPIGTLPQGTPIDSEEGRFMIRMMQAFQRSRSGGLKPFGSTVEFPSSDSAAWQIFRDALGSSSADIAKILLGQDATSGLGKDAPGVGPALFGVRNDIVERDIRDGMEPALTLGTLRPWTALNFGRVDEHPAIEWLIPDADEDARVSSLATRTQSFYAAIKAERDAGCVVDQDRVSKLAVEFRVTAPKLAEVGATKVKLQIAPTDVAKVVRADEIRGSEGLPPFGDERGAMTIPELDARAAAAAEPAEPTAPAPQETPPA